MTETLTLSAEKRLTGRQNQRSVRQDNKVLGIIYGNNIEPIPVALNYSELLRTYRKSGTSCLIKVTVDGKTHNTLVKDISIHPVRGTIEHIDLFVVNPKRKTTVKIPLHFEGTAPAVKNLGGIFNTSHEYVRIRCLPADIPSHFTVDISDLKKIGSNLKLKEIGLDKKYEVVKMDQNVIICAIAGRKAANDDTDDEETAAPAADAPETDTATETPAE